HVHHLGDRIGLAGVDRGGRAELLGHLELGLDHVDGDDVLRAGNPGPLDHVETDTTASDDGDGVACADARGVEGGADTGQHTAADQGGLFEVEVGGDLDGCDLGEDGDFAEGAAAGHLHQR